jgi:hypothetical protein
MLRHDLPFLTDYDPVGSGTAAQAAHRSMHHHLDHLARVLQGNPKVYRVWTKR